MSQVSCHVQYPVNLVPIPRFPLQPQLLLPAEIPLLRHRGGEHLPPTYSHGPPDESELLLSSFDRSRRPSVAHRECVAEDPRHCSCRPGSIQTGHTLSLIHISEPTRLRRISYAVFCL